MGPIKGALRLGLFIVFSVCAFFLQSTIKEFQITVINKSPIRQTLYLHTTDGENSGGGGRGEEGRALRARIEDDRQD